MQVYILIKVIQVIKFRYQNLPDKLFQLKRKTKYLYKHDVNLLLKDNKHNVNYLLKNNKHNVN